MANYDLSGGEVFCMVALTLGAPVAVYFIFGSMEGPAVKICMIVSLFGASTIASAFHEVIWVIVKFLLFLSAFIAGGIVLWLWIFS